jgi:hypothetical protein
MNGKQESNAIPLYNRGAGVLSRLSSFAFYRLRLHFEAVEAVIFPARKAANVLRGGLSLHFLNHSSVYAKLVEPAPGIRKLPGGFDNRPWPFILRAGHLDGATVKPGESFFVDVHYFQVVRPDLPGLESAFSALAAGGIGPGRGRAKWTCTEQLDLLDGPRILNGALASPSVLGFDEHPAPVRSVSVRFASPTELKAGSQVASRPEFPVLIGRLTDRIGILSTLYGRDAVPTEYRALRERASEVEITDCALEWERTVRRSSRTGQVHSIGGFTGMVGYTGPLGEFLPWLLAARWVGVGRQTVWGKGDLRVLSYSA